MGSSLFLIGAVAIALFLWIYAIRLLRQMYWKFREDLRRAGRKDNRLAPLSSTFQPNIIDLIHRSIKPLDERASSNIRALRDVDDMTATRRISTRRASLRA